MVIGVLLVVIVVDVMMELLGWRGDHHLMWIVGVLMVLGR